MSLIKRKVKSFHVIKEACNDLDTSYGVVVFEKTLFKKEYSENVYREFGFYNWYSVETGEDFPEIEVYTSKLSEEIHELKRRKRATEGFLRAIKDKNDKNI